MSGQVWRNHHVSTRYSQAGCWLTHSVSRLESTYWTNLGWPEPLMECGQVHVFADEISEDGACCMLGGTGTKSLDEGRCTRWTLLHCKTVDSITYSIPGAQSFLM
eukprot:320447-Chlamydomonas_euryale.AAC.2